MKYADYKCDECGITAELGFGDGQPFLADVKCKECKGRMRRLWAVPAVKVEAGKTGNSKNGYTTSATGIIPGEPKL